MLGVIFLSVILSLTLFVMYQPGELLQGVARWVNLNVKNEKFRKLLMCPYCFAGQLSLWLYILTEPFVLENLIITVCLSILVTFFTVKLIMSV